jgi:DNA-binding NtrC family response regulator
MNPERLHVLIVENDRAVGTLEAAIVKRSGGTSGLVTTGFEALDSISREAPDVVLLGSPAERSAGLLDLLAGPLKHFAPRTIVLTTSMEDESFLERAAGARVFAVMGMPFDVNTLRDVVANCASNAGRDVDDVTWSGLAASVIGRVTARKPRPSRPEALAVGGGDCDAARQ